MFKYCVRIFHDPLELKSLILFFMKIEDDLYAVSTMTSNHSITHFGSHCNAFDYIF